MIPYTIKRSKRKTVGIYIRPEGRVEVRAPLKLPQADIDKLVAKKETWISRHLAECQQRLAEKTAFTLDYGFVLPVCGTTYPLCSREGGYYGYDEKCFYLPPNLPPEEIKRLTVLLYRDLAGYILQKKVSAYAPLLGVKPASVKVNSAKTHWGSCSGKNRLNFSWRLIMADEDVIDYVVVHELAHIREHNHSKNFWALVESVLPDYLQRKQKLKHLHDKVSRENWD